MSEEKEGLTGTITATEEYLRNHDPKLWVEISSLSTKEQDDLWFNLTQKHLGPYEQALTTGPEAVEELQETVEFQEDEQRLKLLNYFFAESLPVLDRHLPQVGWIYLPQQGFTKFAELQDLFDGVLEAKKQAGVWPFSIMVTGVGIVGKATTRTVLAQELMRRLPDEVVDNLDRDYEKLPPHEWPADVDVRVVEDVHGLDKNDNEEMERCEGVEAPPGGYNLVIYVLRLPQAYKQSLLNRGISWAASGKIDLTAPDRESPESMDEMLEEVASELERTDEVSRDWNKENLIALKELRNQGKSVVIVDPNNYLEALGYTKSADGLSGKSFQELLKERA